MTLPRPVIETVCEDERWRFAKLSELAERALTETLAAFSLMGRYELSLLGCDDARIAELNAEFRGKSAPTNVLSWPVMDRRPEMPGMIPLLPEPDSEAPQELGDLALAYDTCTREADAQGKSLADHTTHLLVHGVLHLLGFDHETEPDAALMEGWETRILAKLGIADPYSLDDP